MSDARTALLVNYEYCDGCHACEVACKKVAKKEQDEYGIKVTKIGPRKKADGKWELNFVPVLTEACDFCADRTASGRKPSCVQHCQSSIIQHGPLAEMLELMNAPKMALYTNANS